MIFLKKKVKNTNIKIYRELTPSLEATLELEPRMDNHFLLKPCSLK